MSEKTSPLKYPTAQRSVNSLKVISGRIVEECNRDLQYPHCIETYKKMFKDATIAPALTYMEMSIAQSGWEVKAPEGASEKTIERAKIIHSMMDDMDSTWADFIKIAATHNRFGFAPVEKVYKKRVNKESKYNDGYYGIKDLVLIAQDSIDSWEFGGNNKSHLTAITQRVVPPTNKGDFNSKIEDVRIPRNKFMLFRADPQKDSPLGTSPLNAVYVAWRFKTELEKHESMSISQEVRGLKELKIPSRYLADDASPEEKATLKYFQDMMALMHRGEQTGIVIPSDVDDTTKSPMFELNVKSVMGQVAHNISDIITRYKKEIVVGILAPQLTIGQDGSGSFALADSLKDITRVVIGARLKEIRDVLNHDLIPQIYQLNGWDSEEMPYFSFENFRQISPDDFSKSIQRLASVGMLVANAETINYVHEFFGLPEPFEDEAISIEEVREYTTPETSRSGDGMEVGKIDGTSDSPSNKDNSISNLEN